MKLPRRKFLHLAAGAAALSAEPRLAWAQAYPSRPVRIIAATGPGGAPDILARLLGLAIREQALGTSHPDVALTLNTLGNVYRDSAAAPSLASPAGPFMSRACCMEFLTALESH